MTHKSVPVVFPLFASALVVALASYNWMLDPDDATKWIISGLFLPVSWGLFELLLRNRPAIYEIRGSVLLAASLLTITLGATVASNSGIMGADGDDISRRAFGIAMGMVLVVIGNFIPKRLEPVLEKSISPERLQSLQRFGGWIFVLGGLGYAGAWLVLPIQQADTVSTLLVATSVVLVAGRWGLLSLSHR